MGNSRPTAREQENQRRPKRCKCNEEVQIQALVDKKKVVITETSIRRDLQLTDENGIECLSNATIFAELERMSAKTTVWNEFSSTTHSNDLLLNGEEGLKLNELMELCTNLSQRVLDLENTKTSQAAEITKIKERVKKLERRNKSRTPGLKRLRKVGRTARIGSFEDEGLGDQEDASKHGRKNVDIDADEELRIVNKVVSTAEVTTASATTTTVDELTLAQTLIEIKEAKPKAVITVAYKHYMLFHDPRLEGSSSQSQSKELDENVEAEVDDEAEMKKHMEIVPDDEVAIDAIPLATKPPIIVDWKIIKEKKRWVLQIVRVLEVQGRYSFNGLRCFRIIDREDLENTLANVEKSTRIQSDSLEAILFKWSTFCEILESAYLYADDLDASDSDCDDVPSAKVVFMANLSSYDSNILSEVPFHDTNIENDMSYQKLLKHENDHLIELLISQDLVHPAVNTLATINDYKTMQQSFMDEYNKTLVLKVELGKKNDMIEKAVYNELLKRCFGLKKRRISLKTKLQQSKESFQTKRPSQNQDAPKFKEFFIINELQVQLKAKNVLIEKLKEHIANIKGKNVVKSVQNVHNSNVVTSKVYKLDLPPLYHCIKNNMVVHELLVYVSATCPSSKHVSDKFVAVTPMNRTGKVRIAESNDTLKDKTQKQCIFDAIHDLYVSDYLNDVNAHVKSKSVKSRSAKSKKKKIWKPTCKVYTNVGYSWKPTGRIFTIDGTVFPLTRIISTKVVPLRKSISTTLVKQTQPSSNKSRKLKDITNVGSSNKSKAIRFKISNHSEPMKNWGSNVSTALSSSHFNFRFRNDQIAKIIGYGDYQLGNLTISRVYNVEGLGHNLFSVGQFCVLDLEVAFRKHTCYVQNLDGVDLLFRSRDINLHTISLDDMLKSSPICFLSKASKTKS
ncbi:hypothetical protein Tco_0394629 [Tanacetum coccineum]